MKTSGPIANRDRIVDIAVVPYDPKQAVSEINPYNKLVNPEVRVSTKRLATHNIRKEELKDASSFKGAWDSVRKEILSKCKGGEHPVLVTHDAKFQVPFLRKELDKCETEFPEWEFVCSMAAAKIVWPTRPATN